MSHGLQIQTASPGRTHSTRSRPPHASCRSAHVAENSRDLAQNYGNSDNDTRHVAVINYIWELPSAVERATSTTARQAELWRASNSTASSLRKRGIHSRCVEPWTHRGRASQHGAIRSGIRSARGTGLGLTPAPNSGYAYITNECAFTNPPWGSASNNERNQWYGQALGLGCNPSQENEHHGAGQG